MTGRERKLKARLDRRRARYRRHKGHDPATLEGFTALMGFVQHLERQPTPRPWGWMASLRRLQRRPSPILKHLKAYVAAHPELAGGGRQMIVPLYTSRT